MKIIQPSVDATAATLGIQPTKVANPERVESIPNVSFIEDNFVTFQQRSQFILK